MAIAKLDLSGLLALNQQIQALPAQLNAEAQGIIAETAKEMDTEASQSYHETFTWHSGELAGSVVAEQQSSLAWRVFNAWGKAHWFEYVPGTKLRWTKDSFTATARRRARKQAGGAFRGQVRVQAAGTTIGGFSGSKATRTTKSTAVFHPIFIPLAIRHRAEMVTRLKGLLEKAGAVVTGHA